MKQKWLNKWDIGLIISIVFLGFVLCFFVYSTDNGNFVEIEVDSNKIATLSINEDTTYKIEKNGIVTNVVEIKNGEVSMIDANCRDKICVNHKKIKRNNESIICLPNKVIVTVVSNNESDVDGVVR